MDTAYPPRQRAPQLQPQTDTEIASAVYLDRGGARNGARDRLKVWAEAAPGQGATFFFTLGT